MHFSFNDEIYVQTDGVVMGSPLGPILANISMVELENTIIPHLKNEIIMWKRCVDDTICFEKDWLSDSLINSIK